MNVILNVVRKFLVLPTLAVLVSCSIFGYSSPEIHARVVTPTGEPIEGAIVVANWGITSNWFNAPLGQLALYEAVTNKNGEFRIPQWGPRHLSKGTIQGTEPTVRIFHPDFVPLVINNGFTLKSAAAIIKFRLQDQDITLEPSNGSVVEYEAALRTLNHSLDFIFLDPPVTETGRCYWKVMPKMLSALQEMTDKLQREGQGKSLESYKQFLNGGQPHCVDTNLIFQELKNE
jgi:hypothetical protein